MSPGPALVIGLGNPGPDYADTRHNVGFGVVELLAARAGGGRFSKHRTNADVLEGRLAGRRVVFAKPRTYMNVSGGPVAGLVRYFSVPVEDLIVIHDDLDLGFGVIRLKRGGGEGGHNGLPARPVRHRPSSGPPGPGRLRAQAFLRHRAQGAGVRDRPGGRRRGGIALRRIGTRPEQVPRTQRLIPSPTSGAVGVCRSPLP
jgi:hypothetical protein